MKPFKWMFEEQNATEIEYKGKQVSSFYRYDKKGKYRLKFTFVSTNSCLLSKLKTLDFTDFCPIFWYNDCKDFDKNKSFFLQFSYRF